jgi:hypothetical protein
MLLPQSGIKRREKKRKWSGLSKQASEMKTDERRIKKSRIEWKLL